MAAAAGVVVGDLDLTPALASLGWLALLGADVAVARLPVHLDLAAATAGHRHLADPAVQPVITVGLSMVLLGERPSTAQLAGVALVIGGIAVATVPLARLRDAIAGEARRAAHGRPSSIA